MKTSSFLGKICALFFICAVAHAEVSVKDDTSTVVRLTVPAKRIISLAPHITEILFAAGAGSKVVAVDQSSDYPADVMKLPRVGSSSSLDLEAVVALHPDLIVVWKSGINQAQLARLRKLGLKFFVSEPQQILDVPDTIERLGILAGVPFHANNAAEQFRGRYKVLTQTYAGRAPLSVFYQIWDRPLTTINNRHLISDVMHLCGAQNAFGTLPLFTPTLNQEAVLLADPEAIIGADKGNTPPGWLEAWRRWPRLKAVQYNNLFFLDPDIIHRHSPRLLQGVEKMCEAVEQGRKNRAAARANK